MKLSSFPGCCTARVLHDLGGTGLSAGRKSAHDKLTVKKWLANKVKDHKGLSCLVIMTNNQQATANTALKELGFECSDWMKKAQHPESRLRLWWKEP